MRTRDGMRSAQGGSGASSAQQLGQRGDEDIAIAEQRNLGNYFPVLHQELRLDPNTQERCKSGIYVCLCRRDGCDCAESPCQSDMLAVSI